MITDRRFKFLTTRQREIAAIAKENGYVTYAQIKVLYSAKEHIDRAIEKLIAFNVLIPNKGSGDGNVLYKKFIYNPGPEEDQVQKTLENGGKENDGCEINI